MLFRSIIEGFWPSLEVRIFLWKSTFSMIFSSFFRFVLGWGPGNFFTNFPDFEDIRLATCTYTAEVIDYPHNFFIETLAEYGFIGLFLLCFWLFTIMQNFLKKKSCVLFQKDCTIIGLALFFLIMDAQFSISMSYTQCQFIAALSIAWLAASISQNEENHSKIWIKQKFALILFAIFFPIFLTIWKIDGFDFLVFHIEYKTAKKALFHERVEKMLYVKTPIFEDIHTLQWRNNLGAAIIDSNDVKRIVAKNLADDFLLLDNLMPRFGHFYIYKGILMSKLKKKDKANESFVKYANKNPFSGHLWRWWEICCQNDGASSEIMLKTIYDRKKKYGSDISFDFAKAMVLRLENKKDESDKDIKKVIEKGKEILKIRYVKRIDDIVKYCQNMLNE